MRVEVGSEGAEGLERGDHAGLYIFAVEKLLKAFPDALVGGL